MLRYLYPRGILLRELTGPQAVLPLLHTLFSACASSSSSRSRDGRQRLHVHSVGIGREQAAKRFLICHYIGPAPVSVSLTPLRFAARTSGWLSPRAFEDVLCGPGVDQPFPGRPGARSSPRNRFSFTAPATVNSVVSRFRAFIRTHRHPVCGRSRRPGDRAYDPAVHEIASADERL